MNCSPLLKANFLLYNGDSCTEIPRKRVFDMSQVIFENPGASFATPVPDEFILHYLPSASGTYVKVYLYVFYHYFRAVPGFSLTDAADALGLMEADVMEALQYWDKKGLLRLQRTPEACRIQFFPAPAPDPSSKTRKAPPEAEAAKVVRVERKPVYSPEELSLYQKSPQIRQLFAAAQKFLGGNISFPNLSLLYSFYDYYRLPVDVIEYLMEYCTQSGNTNLRYMEKIVQDWADKDVRTLEAAQKQIQYFKEQYPVMKALGLSGRRPSETEQQYINRWLHEYQSAPELITEAASRTLKKTGKASFPYMDGILKNWHENRLKTLEDVRRADTGFAGRKASGTRGAFHTYSSAGSDYDQIGENVRRQLYADSEGQG